MGNEVMISVADTGAGIPADKLPHVFDEFFQVDLSLRRSYQGAGLGLAISKRFVESHGGYIWVESQEGKGSTFFFTLPVMGNYIPPLPVDVADLPAPQWPEKKPRIFMVDPDPMIAALAQRHLEKYEVLQVESADQLPQAVLVHHPRAVIYNRLPAKEADPDEHDINIPAPCFECSLPSQAWITAELAVAACLTKPISAEQLLNQIKQLGQIDDILIIDDDRGFVQLIERVLKAAGQKFELRWAYDGEEGLSAMRRQKPDLVLLDLVMPGLSGLQVLDQMQQEAGLAQVPVVLLTATSYIEDTLAQQKSSRIVVRRPDGLHPGEVFTCLSLLIDALEPHYDKQILSGEVMSVSSIETIV
jgi:CheY-like chemotaxis protein